MRTKTVTTTEAYKWDNESQDWTPTDKVVKTEESQDLSAPQYTPPPWTAPIYPPQSPGWWQSPLVSYNSDSASEVKYAGAGGRGFPPDWQ